MEIKQYKVEKGIATPVNHLETATEGDFYRRKSEGVNWGDFLHEQWHKFEDEKAAHTYATNAQDGVYDADCFKLKWQCYDHDREQWQDAEQSAECTWEKFNEWFRTTRKHLQLIDNPIPKMETTELPSHEKKQEFGEWNTDTKLMDKVDSERLVVFFENGDWLSYNSDNWPMCEVVAWLELPALPHHLNQFNP